jgi:prepilin-type N-terminal cleavage/methylation domain-containing protein
MLKNLKKRSEGFTIIEVLIVLAIAGLIMLIVFLAVPALQRNNRNTQRKSDVAALLGATAEYVNNNGGQLPTASGDFNTVFVNANAKLGFYPPANADYNYSAAARAAVPAFPAGNDTVVVYNYLKCANATTGTLTGASARSIAALYRIEGSSTDVTQCQES